MRRLVLATVLAASAAGFTGAGPAAAICRPFIGPICLPSCPLPDPNDPLHWSCPL